MTMIPSGELVSVLLGVTGDEPEVIAQRTNEFEVTVRFPQGAVCYGILSYFSLVQNYL